MYRAGLPPGVPGIRDGKKSGSGIIFYIRNTDLVGLFRDTEVCIVPASLLEFLKVRSTAVLSKLVQVLGNRLLSLRPRASSQLSPRQQQQHKLSSVGSGVELTSGRIHYDSVAVITISKGMQYINLLETKNVYFLIRVQLYIQSKKYHDKC